MHQHTARAAVVAASVLVSAPTVGQDDTTVSPVVVTATRTAQTADESLASVSVINRREIEQSQAQSLPDLLATQHGLSVARNGPYGKSTSVFMRGTNSDHVLVLIDGVKLGSATTGTTAFQHLPLDQVERIEIVRGPRSSLYGSEAVGGVIQIFTRKGESGEPRVNTTAMAGGNGTSEVTTAISGGDEDTRLALSAKAFETDGIDARSDGFPDEDGYTNDSVSFSVSQDLGETTTWSLDALHADGTSEFDNCGSFTSPSQDCEDQFAQQAVTSRLETQITPSWTTSLSGGQTRDESELFTDGAFDSRFNTIRDEASWQNDVTLGTSQLLTLGLDYRNDEVESTTDFDETERSNEAAFAQWQYTGERTDAQLSARVDDNEAYGEQSTGSVAGGYRIGDDLRVYGSYGTAFKAPTFNDLFFPSSPFFSSNPDLDPEESETLEVGIEGGRAFAWSVNLYHTEIDDIIVFDAAAATVNNLNRAEINGLELAGRTTLGGWDFRASATLIDTELDTDGANDGNELPRRPDRKINLDASRDFGAVSLGTHVRHEGDRFDDAANSIELDGFTVVGARLEYELHKAVRLEASVENLTDEEYQTIDNFNTLGRTAYLRLRYQM